MRSVVLTLAILSGVCASPRVETHRAETSVEQTVKVGKMTLTFDELRKISASAAELLRTATLGDPVPPPGEPLIGYEDMVLLGAWRLVSDDPDLRLTYTIANTPLVRVQQQIRIARVDGQWKAVSTGQMIAHARRP